MFHCCLHYCAVILLPVIPDPAVGAFELIEAASIKAGDLFPVLTDPDNPSAGFTAVAVTAAGPVEAEGM